MLKLPVSPLLCYERQVDISILGLKEPITKTNILYIVHHLKFINNNNSHNFNSINSIYNHFINSPIYIKLS